MSTIHIVTVHHRGKAMLARCLESLEGSTDVELEIVVVSNDCQEELPEIVETSSRIHLVEAPAALGFSAANNLGVSWARERFGEPDYYYFINNDTVSEPDALATQVAALEQDEVAAIAGPQLRILGAPDHLNSLGINLTEDGWGWDEGIGIRLDDYGPLPDRRSVLAVTGSALLADAGVYRRIGGWTEIYHYYFEDIDLCLKVWKSGQRVIQVPEALVHHRISATMTEGSERKEFLFWRNRLMLSIIHWPPTLLASVLHRAVVTEILSNRWADNAMQRKALRQVFGRLPGLLRQRWRSSGSNGEWRSFLHPPKSVPVITLREITLSELDGESAARTNGGQGSGGALASDPEAEIWEGARDLKPVSDGGRRVLVVGWSPLPFQNERMNYAPGVRSWQLARPLAVDGHAVCLVCGRIPGAYDSKAPAVEAFERDGVLCYTLDESMFGDDSVLAGLVAEFRPEVVVGVSALPSRRAARIAAELPLWVDLFGDPMAEAQAKAMVDEEHDHVGAYWHLLLELLERGDAFAAVSERQRHAVLGQLGLAGRLNRDTAGVELVHTVPCTAPSRGAGENGEPPQLRDVADGDLVVLWSGGYNTWSDVDTLFAALEEAMAERPEMRFVSTGGGIPGHDDDSYARFQELAKESRFRERFLFKGCLPEEEAAHYFRRADLGVVTERRLAERTLGSSGRVLRWMADGLPFVCTGLSELGETAEAEGLGWTYPAGDASALASRIVAAAEDPGSLREVAERARAYVESHFTPQATTLALREWVAEARRAPDLAAVGETSDRSQERGLFSARLGRLRSRLEETEADLTQVRRENDDLVERIHSLKSELGGIHESRMWGWWMTYLRIRRVLLWPFRR